MSSSNYMIQMSSGQSLSVYQASSAPVNSVLHTTFIGMADSSTQTTDFSVMTDSYITDVVSDDNLTSGGFEIYDVSGGVRSNLGINNLGSYHVTNNNRHPPRLGFRRGNVYRLLQTVVGS